MKELRYKIQTGSVNYEGAMPVTFYRPECSVTLKEGVAVVTMTVEFNSFEAAQRAVEPHLRNWEIYAGLKHGREVLVFRYAGGEGTDINGQPIYHCVFYADTLRQVQGKERKYPYPSLPTEFEATKEVEILRGRLCSVVLLNSKSTAGHMNVTLAHELYHIDFEPGLQGSVYFETLHTYVRIG